MLGMRRDGQWVFSLIGALALAGCVSDVGTDDATGSLSLAIDLGGTDGGLTIDEVHWNIVTDPGGALLDQGAINVSQPGSTASFEKFGLFPGDYIVVLTAMSTDQATTCSGSAPFTIVADATTDVSVLLNCTTAERLGAVRVDGTFNRCAELTMVVVSPLQVSVGFHIDLMATADDDEGDAIKFRWSATGGTIADPTIGSDSDPAESMTTYTCGASGTQTVTVEVSDDAFVYCLDSWTVEVGCVPAALCGNGVLDPGEHCDPPNGVTCDADCQRIPTCGDGIVDPGEDCDPPDAVYCDKWCELIDPCDPNPCDDGNACTADVCWPHAATNTAACGYPVEPDGTACDSFAPNAGVCLSGDCMVVPPPVSQTVQVACSNNVTGDISVLPYTLTVGALGPVVDGVPVDLSLTGVALFPTVFLNAAIATIPGLTEVTLNAANATPYVRSGAVGSPADLALLGPASGAPAQVAIPITSDPLICGTYEPPLATCPDYCEDNITRCTDSSECVGIGSGTCDARAGFCECVVDPLQIPLSAAIVTVIPSGSEMLLGWNEDLLPPQPVIAIDPPGPNGLRVLAIVLNVGLECWMGRVDDNGTPGDASDDFARQLMDSEMLSIPINP